MSSSILTLLDHIEKTIIDLGFGSRRGDVNITGPALGKLKAYSDCLKLLLPVTFTKTVFADFNGHLSYMERFFGERNFEWIMNNLDDIRDRDLPSIKESINKFIESKKVQKKKTMPLSDNVFIVHGRNHEPMKDLKTMLKELGLNPIVLHDLPSGSMTIVEKLERYSDDLGFAFAILTPDDVGFELNRFKSLLRTATFKINNKEYFLEETITHELKRRARQNVLLEFGFLISKLSRSRVCCLYKGNVELPSDMKGIVYIAFKESVNEVRDKIVKELKAAGYEIKI